MEKLNYSILTCAYSNGEQFYKFLLTARMQNFKGFEVVVADNATPTNEIKDSFIMQSHLTDVPMSYLRIEEKDKKCCNSTQGINLAARRAQGEYVVIFPDSNVILSLNLLAEIDKALDNGAKVVTSGGQADIKISPDGKYETEYAAEDPARMAKVSNEILCDMGWPADPGELKLIDGKYRCPKPHRYLDVYMIAMERKIFLESPYAIDEKSWGNFHQDFVADKIEQYGATRLENIRIIHQWHRVWKDQNAKNHR